MQWFATHVDRDFETQLYGNGTRIYCRDFDEEYKIITGYSFDGNILKVKDKKGNIIELNNDPDNKYFDNTIKREWQIWDQNEGYCYEDNRADYEPWAYNSLLALAVELGVYELSQEEKIGFKMFYGK